MSLKDSVCTNYSKDSRGNEAGCRNWRGQPLICPSELAVSRPRRGSLALVLLHAWAWLEKLFGGQRVLFSIARGRSAGKEGKKNFSGPKKFFLTHFSLAAVKPLSRPPRAPCCGSHRTPWRGSKEPTPNRVPQKKTGRDPNWQSHLVEKTCRMSNFFSRPGHFPRLS